MSDDATLVTAPELRAMLGDGAELALLDVREEGVFSKAHLLTAASLPLSKLEMRVDAMVPRRGGRAGASRLASRPMVSSSLPGRGFERPCACAALDWPTSRPRSCT